LTPSRGEETQGEHYNGSDRKGGGNYLHASRFDLAPADVRWVDNCQDRSLLHLVYSGLLEVPGEGEIHILEQGHSALEAFVLQNKVR